MENDILADTSVLVDLQRGAEKTIERFGKIQERIVISRITACEFIFGSISKKEKKINKEFIENLTITEISPEISKCAYFILDKYGLGTKFGISDAMIAATAIFGNYQLWTLNRRHFQRIKEIKMF